MTPERLQVFRTIDKFDKLGKDGVIELIQKPVSEFGANLMPWQAVLIGEIFDTKGAFNNETLSNLSKYMKRVGMVSARFKLMTFLEENVGNDRLTAWDRLLGMKPNVNETWDFGGRPANIAWAIDDIIGIIRASFEVMT